MWKFKSYPGDRQLVTHNSPIQVLINPEKTASIEEKRAKPLKVNTLLLIDSIVGKIIFQRSEMHTT